MFGVVDCCLLFVVRRLLFWYVLLFGVSCVWFAVCCLLIVVHVLLFVVCWLLVVVDSWVLVVGCWLSVSGHCVLFVVCCLLCVNAYMLFDWVVSCLLFDRCLLFDVRGSLRVVCRSLCVVSCFFWCVLLVRVF